MAGAGTREKRPTTCPDGGDCGAIRDGIPEEHADGAGESIPHARGREGRIVMDFSPHEDRKKPSGFAHGETAGSLARHRQADCAI